jgi:glutathione S-transferase
MQAPTNWNDTQSWMASVARLGRGLRARVRAQAPAQPLELYEFEACPYCRKVRDALSELDLDYVSYPCARGSRHREAVKARGGRTRFPYLVDPNTGRAMYESEDIIDYLWQTYAGSPRPRLARSAAPLDTLGSSIASALRPRARHVVGTPTPPAQRLEMYGFEASPYCRKVREALNELDLPCLVHNVAKGGARRPELVARGGKMQVPYLVDPNAGVEMYESDAIVRHLHATYGAGGS